MAIIIVEYNPPISEETQKLIRNKVTPSMISIDETSCQYEIGAVVEVLEELDDLADEKDLLLINDLINEGVNFIEI